MTIIFKRSLVVFSILFFLTGVYATAKNKMKGILDLMPNLEEGKKIYELCATCYNADGWWKEDGSFPVFAGQHRAVIIKQLADICARDRENPTMYPFAGDDVIGGAQGLEDVSEYISQLPLNFSISTGDSIGFEAGQNLFNKKCMACYGSAGQGNTKAFFLNLQGQNYAYLLRQLKWIRDGRRKNANPAMLALIKNMDDETLSKIPDYISRIPVSKR